MPSPSAIEIGQILITVFALGPLQANCYLVADKASKEAMLVDVGHESKEMVQYIKEQGYIPKAIVATHAHFDHIFGMGWMSQQLDNCPIICHKEDASLWPLNGRLSSMFGMQSPAHFPSEPTEYGG
ncbi:hypothetical protein KIPB_002432 [Kipferlia bialata]|uniref:Metallo-beta-lactamase domain-containing protein n=1 Tax=Kipferlia bialata TaxID=797122 RepID=A0A391NPN0_9EUKA|nr:hypothetical protein KIPB_002432 [Kipferlia bialata]|eukprot:g2432.t1